MKLKVCVLLAVFALQVCWVGATETENQGMRILPAPGHVSIDGDTKDWDLSGGAFVCSDAENLRERIGCWFHAMWDQDNLYVLARFVDDTPLNNPGRVSGDQGFAGDCLQFRTICFDDKPVFGRPESDKQRTTHVTAWRDRDKADVINFEYGLNFDQGGLKDARSKGAIQAFRINDDGKGYVQEMSIPWSLLARPGWTPAAGRKLVLTVEPNFGTDTHFRISLKDLFRPGVVPDRVFTFMSAPCWSEATLEPRGNVDPQPLRLSDGRLFNVSMKAGVPTVDWSGLYQEKKLAGFAPIRFTMPEDGYVSLNILNEDGQVVRQLLTANFFTKGDHEVKWDGLTTMNYRRPGVVAPAGKYSWEAIWHKGLGLRLVGWACNAGHTPFDSPGGNWGGDMSSPCTVSSTADSIILGWGASEAGRAVVCTDLQGKVKWRHKRGGFGGAALVAADNGIVYVYDQGQGNTLYRLSAAKGDFSAWEQSKESELPIDALLPGISKAAMSGMDAHDGKLYLSFGGRSGPGQTQPSADTFAVVDGKTGKLIQTFKIHDPGQVAYAAADLVYVTSDGGKIIAINPASGAQKTVTTVPEAHGLCVDPAGNIFVATRDPDNQVKIFDPQGKQLRVIGKAGGRALLGKWEPDGMRFAEGIHIDPSGKLWVTENDSAPRRISVWNAADGAFIKELFGPTDYGAGGGAICPADPLTMFGHGCEWHLDKESGLATCVAVVTREHVSNARFSFGPMDAVYLTTCSDFWKTTANHIYQRLAPGVWKLRTELMPVNREGKPVETLDTTHDRLTGIAVWSDSNDDQQMQPDEVHIYKKDLEGWINGWYLPMTQSLIDYGSRYKLAPTGFTACGAPMYDPSTAPRIAAPEDIEKGTGGRGGMGARLGCGTEDGSLMLYNDNYGEVHSDFECFDIASGKLKWAYPSNFCGVHGGHMAPPAQVGLIRGAYDIVGSVKMPAPIGDLFAIATDKGEWHLLTRDGFYLSSLFQADPLKIQWPDPAVPGAIMDNVPPGMGAEDFGGSICATKDGQLYVQAGKTAFINMKVVGLETVKKLGAGSVEVSEQDLVSARKFRDSLTQLEAGEKLLVVPTRTVSFSGDPARDFGGQGIAFTKNNAKVASFIARDNDQLYLAWTVDDATPWLNGATDPVSMYAKGDTVDFQLAANSQADANRTDAAAGDLRLSIGNFQGKPTAVLYRPISDEKHPRTFYSGTVKQGWEVQSVQVLDHVSIKLAIDAPGRRYSIEAAVPLNQLHLQPKSGMTVQGDFGVTFGAPVGDKTMMRSYWSNQATDFVADEVWELKLAPNNWGKLKFE